MARYCQPTHLRLRALVYVDAQHIHHLVHRPDVDVLGKLVLFSVFDVSCEGSDIQPIVTTRALRSCTFTNNSHTILSRGTHLMTV